MTLSADVSSINVGKFWRSAERRSYMWARFAAVDNLLKKNTVAVVEKALTHFMDMLRLDKSDSIECGKHRPRAPVASWTRATML
jgi:hypothetical protein